jgi:tRNA (cytidine/uridine-2'-O-)-methyltransferase
VSSFGREPLHVVLVAPEIHWNTGNAGRTCLAAGARLHLVRPLGFSLDERRIRRAGLDYWEHVRPVLWDDWDQLDAALPARPWLFTPEATASLWEIEIAAPAILVFGRESSGLPSRLRERHPDRLVRIPTAPGAVRSLNLSSCVAVAAFEAGRRLARPGEARPLFRD